MDNAAFLPPPRRDRRLSAVPLLLTLALMLWWLLTIVDSAFQQGQMTVFADNVILPRWSLDALMLACLVWMLLQRGWQPQLSVSLLLAWLFFGFYLILSLIFLEARFGDTLDELIPTFYRMYFFSMLLPFTSALEGSFTPRQMEMTLLIVAMPLGAIGLDQYIQNDPVLPTASIGNTWQVYSWKLEDQVRAFSLFNSGWSFGHFMAFAAILALLKMVKRSIPAALGFGLFLAFAFCIYICRTRTAYLVAAASLATALLMLMVPARRRESTLALLPLLWLFVAYMVASGIRDILRLLGIGGDTGVLNSASLDARHEAWTQYFDVWFADPSNALFGAAITQKDSGQLLSESTVLIDNAFIAIGAQIGLVGLLLWLFLFWRTWRFLLAETLRRDDALSWTIAAVWAAWPMSLMFGTSTVFYASLALLAMLSRVPQLPVSRRARPLVSAQFGQQGVGQ